MFCQRLSVSLRIDIKYWTFKILELSTLVHDSAERIIIFLFLSFHSEGYLLRFVTRNGFVE